MHRPISVRRAFRIVLALACAPVRRFAGLHDEAGTLEIMLDWRMYFPAAQPSTSRVERKLRLEIVRNAVAIATYVERHATPVPGSDMETATGIYAARLVEHVRKLYNGSV